MIDLETIQRIALVAVEKEPWDYSYRKICRWFSMTYSTPLHTVELDLDHDYVLQHYFEHIITRMRDTAEELEASAASKEAWDKLRSNIISGYKKAAEEDELIEESEQGWDDELKKIIEEEEKAARKDKPEPPVIAEQSNVDSDLIFGMDQPIDDTPPDY